jgi:D-alanyl-D-alanine carboxypeptidase
MERYDQGTAADWEKMLIAALPHLQYVVEPGTRFLYSNMGYATLGAALSRAANQSYLRYVPAHIFAPLGMTHTALQLTPALQAHLSSGYELDGDRVDAATPLREQAGRGYRVPNGAVYTTVGDLARFASFLMGNGPERVLKTASLEHDLDQVIVPSNSRMTEGYGLGFMVRRRDTYVAFGHGGDVAGYQAALYINRDKGIGFILLANARGDTIPSGDLALRALDVLSK